MTLAKRFGFYGIGFTMGIVMLFFFFNGKRARCTFFPNARILKIIREKPLSYSDKALYALKDLNIDSTAINKILLEGNIDFSKSKTRQEPCRFYWINGIANKKDVVLYIANCDSIATVENISLKN